MRGIVLRVCLGLALLLTLAGTAEAASPNVVISEFRTRGPAGGNDEFVELYNPTAAPVAIGGDKIMGSSNTAPTGTRATVPAGTILDPGCHFLAVNTGSSGYSGSVAGDVTYSTGVSDNGGIALTLADGTILDQVGVATTGTAYKEGTPLATQLTTNVDRSYERKPGGAAGSGQDTDDNASDFVLRSPSDPQDLLSTCIGSTTPTNPSGTGSATPATVETGSSTLLTVAVSPGSNPTSTGLAVSADLSSIGGSASQQLYDDGTHGDATANDDTFSFDADVPSSTATGAKTLPVSISDAQARTGSASIALTVTAPTAITHIHTIQGAAQLSPLNGQRVTNVQGIVTAVVPGNGGFYMQDPDPDADPATSEGIFVFSTTSPAVGDLVRVDARVNEFYAGGATNGLPTTELSSTPTVSVLSHGNALPDPVIAGTGGRIPPQAIAQTGDVTQRTTFDPANDALDFWESLEGMRVQVNDPVATGPQNSFGELPVVGDNGANATPRTPRGGVVLGPGNPNGERIVLNDQILPTPPVVNVGDHFTTPAVGVVNYDFGYWELNITQPLTRVDSGLQREVTAQAGPRELSVATFNVENLSVGDGDAKFNGLADRIVNNLRSPDIVTLEEVQDNDGPTDDGVVDSDQTLNKLVAAITAAGGPSYSYTYISPDNDQDGGQPGGNIRIAFLYDTAAGVSLPAGATKGDSDTPDSVVTDADGKPHLALDPGRIDPTSDAWQASRKPLAGEFLFRGQTYFVIGNHFDSKIGDDPLTGRYQPPAEPSAVQRHQQAQIVHDFVAQIVGDDPDANVIVLGDLNDFQFSETDHILEGGSTPILTDMIDTLPVNEQYSYVYEGNSEVLDHILVSHAIASGTRTFDVVHINAEFQDQLSDHDPSVLHVLADAAPVVSAGGPYTVAEGATTTLTATGSDPNGDDVTYSWDLDGDGTPDATGRTVTFDAAQLDGPEDVKVTVTASDGSATSSDSALVHVTNVAPTASLDNVPSSSPEGTTVHATGSATDPSPADQASLTSTWTVTKNGAPFASGTGTAISFTPDDNGTYVVTYTASDDDGGSDTATATDQVTNAAPTVSIGGAPATALEGSAVTATASATDPGSADGTPAFTWSVTKDGAPYASGSGANVSYTPNDNGTYVLTVTATDKDGGSGTASATTQVSNVAPTATFNAPAQATSGAPFTISLTAPSDPSTADTSAGFTYAFDCGSGFGAYGSVPTAACTAGAAGTQTVGGRIRDKDGGVSTYTAIVQVGAATLTPGQLCTLTVQYVESSAKYKALPAPTRRIVDALAQAACNAIAKLPTPAKPAAKAAAVAAYSKAVNALLAGGWLTADQAATLIRDAQAL